MVKVNVVAGLAAFCLSLMHSKECSGFDTDENRTLWWELEWWSPTSRSVDYPLRFGSILLYSMRMVQ